MHRGRSVERPANRARDVTESLADSRKFGGSGQEPMRGAKIAARHHRHPGLEQPARIILSVIAQGIDFGGEDERGR